MPQLNLKPNHKAIRDYYATLQEYEQQGIRHEGAVSNSFAFFLDSCTKQVNGTFIAQYAMHTAAGKRIVIDGLVRNEFELPLAYWEAKDVDDDLLKAVKEKRDAGRYPTRGV